jgi:hypothetical protein
MTTRFDRGSLLAASMLLVTLCFGIVAGVALDRWVFRSGRHYAGQRLPGLTAGERFDPARVRSQASDRLALSLDLSLAQRAQVDSLFGAQQQAAGAVMREMRPRLDSITDRTQSAMRAILTPEQYRKLDRMRHLRTGPRPHTR